MSRVLIEGLFLMISMHLKVYIVVMSEGSGDGDFRGDGWGGCSGDSADSAGGGADGGADGGTDGRRGGGGGGGSGDGARDSFDVYLMATSASIISLRLGDDSTWQWLHAWLQ